MDAFGHIMGVLCYGKITQKEGVFICMAQLLRMIGSMQKHSDKRKQKRKEEKGMDMAESETEVAIVSQKLRNSVYVTHTAQKQAL